MSFFKKIIWIAYAAVFIDITIEKTLLFFIPGSKDHFYFYFLKNFDVHFLPNYFINATQILLNLIHCIPLILYTLRIRFLPSVFWQCLLILRIIFDIFGHSFGYKEVLAYFQDDLVSFLLIGGTTLGFYIPSYYICIRYAFFQENYLRK